MRFFKLNNQISGIGIQFSETDLFKFGKPTTEAKFVEVDPYEHIVGFFGASGAEYIT